MVHTFPDAEPLSRVIAQGALTPGKRGGIEGGVKVAGTERGVTISAERMLPDGGVVRNEERFRGLSFSGRKLSLPGAGRSPAESRYTVVASGRAPVKPGRFNPAGGTLPYLPAQIAFVDGILGRAGLNPRHYRLSPLVRRIPASMRALKVDSLEAAREETERSPESLLLALNALLIGTTAFFRDRPVFEELRRHVVPVLLERSACPRIWSAGCSDGAELYSVAMLIARHGTGEPILLGTDCRASALARARAGMYPLAAVSEMPSDFRRDYLECSGAVAVVKESIRGGIKWQHGDIMERRGTSRWDLVLCRNLAIYLEPGPMQQLWKNLSMSIVPGGYLVVGRAEKPRLDGFSCVAPCVYQKNSLPASR